ncbi:MAG: P-loop NTPase [Planctomycetaceae bacterium]|nr:P-loop NTPase [Planctomycetaceae bacterium]
MPDQAHELRQLIERAASSRYVGVAPRTVAVCGGKGGVGTTTVAIHLAQALVRDGRRTVLVDASCQSGGIATHCHLTPGASIHEVVAGRRSVHEALQPGLGGLLVLPGSDDPRREQPLGERQVLKLLDALAELGRFADYVVLDAGHGASPHAQTLLRHTDLRLIVATPDNVSVMDTYALLKQSGGWLGAVVVNMSDNESASHDVQARLTLAARRFLGTRVLSAGVIRRDRRLSEATHACDLASSGLFGFEQLAEFVVRHASDEATAAKLMQIA